MIIPNSIKKEMYDKLGNLFYAVAVADGKVKREEYFKMQEVFTKEASDDTDENQLIDVTAIEAISEVFKNLAREDKESQECFEEFEKFYQVKQQLFGKELKLLIWKVANAIAASYSGKNKSELVVLAQLYALLK